MIPLSRVLGSDARDYSRVNPFDLTGHEGGKIYRTRLWVCAIRNQFAPTFPRYSGQIQLFGTFNLTFSFEIRKRQTPLCASASRNTLPDVPALRALSK